MKACWDGFILAPISPICWQQGYGSVRCAGPNSTSVFWAPGSERYGVYVWPPSCLSFIFRLSDGVVPLLLSVHFRSRQRSLLQHWPGPVTALPMKACWDGFILAPISPICWQQGYGSGRWLLYAYSYFAPPTEWLWTIFTFRKIGSASCRE